MILSEMLSPVGPMNVTFKRTGERRYGVFVERDRAPALVMHPAPGDDEFLLHDMLHFVAKAEWGSTAPSSAS